jgi:hypothetical protein
MIVITAPEDDFHAFVVCHVLREQYEIDCRIVDLSAFPSAARFSLEIGSRGQQIRYDGSGGGIDWDDVTAVWWRRPHPRDPGDANGVPQSTARFIARERTSLITSIFDRPTARVVNRPQSQLLASCKGTQLLAAQELAVPIPASLITNSRDEAAEFRQRHPRCVYKALTWRDDSKLIATEKLTGAELDDAAAFQAAPVIVQELLPPGEDIRVNIFGDEVYAAEKTVESIDGRLDAQLWREHTLPGGLGSKLVRLLGALGLDYGCADLRRLPDGRYFFLEVNPAGQFLMVERDTKQPLVESLCRLLTRAPREATGTHRRLPRRQPDPTASTSASATG